MAMMLAYSFYLKHVVLLDLMIIAAGFVLRAMAGALVIDVPISPWLYVVTALGALFLAINKRRAEIVLLKEDANEHRPILEEYTPPLLDQMASIVTASTLVAYGLYTFTAPALPTNHSMMLTIPFVLYGIFRYLYLVHARGEGGSPEEVLLKDCAADGWTFCCGWRCPACSSPSPGSRRRTSRRARSRHTEQRKAGLRKAGLNGRPLRDRLDWRLGGFFSAGALHRPRSVWPELGDHGPASCAR